MSPEERIAQLEERLDKMEKVQKFTIYKTLQMLDGRDIQAGKTTGTTIGTETTQKVGFHTAKTVQQSALSDLNTVGGDDDSTARNRCNAITAVLKAYGLIA